MIQEISVNKSQNKYVIPHQRKNTKRELNMQAKIKTKNRKQLKVKALIDLGCIYIEIDEQLVKNEKIKTKLINFSFKVYNMDRTKNGDVTRVVPLEVEINRYKETFKVVVMDLNGMDIFLGHDWLVKHNLEVNWRDSKIQFTRCLGLCRMKYQDIEFKTRMTQVTETLDKNKLDKGKELDLMNPEDLLDYIQPFIYLFNKKKFEKLPKRRKWDHKINLTEEVPRKLDTKAYTMTIKEEEALCNSLIRAVVSRVVDKQLVDSMRSGKKNTGQHLQRNIFGKR